MGILARLSLKTFTALALSLTPALFAAGSAEAAKGIRHEVPAGKSSVLTVPAPIERVSVTDPEIADVLVISATELQINGKKLGSTSLIIWDKQKNKTFFDIEVVVDISELKDQIKEVAPGDEIIFRMLSPDTLVVSGKVSTEERKTKIHNLLLGFGRDITEMVVYNLQGGTVVETRDTGGIEEGKGYKFVMLLEISDPVQVLLQITVAAIDRNATKSLGINVFYIGREVAMFSSVGSSAPFNVLKDFVSGSRFGPGTDSESTFQNNPNFGVIHAPSGTAWLLKALAGKGLAKILAEPNLIVKSGSS
ncbi:MAG TPA: pilus assembly protein N-terminal domain-containing protein, partial [Nitrospirota bacterium]|nr:pilus assembly protein N-terminal domain-containing protein [Nitrospirota bacterium]